MSRGRIEIIDNKVYFSYFISFLSEGEISIRQLQKVQNKNYSIIKRQIDVLCEEKYVDIIPDNIENKYKLNKKKLCDSYLEFLNKNFPSLKILENKNNWYAKNNNPYLDKFVETIILNGKLHTLREIFEKSIESIFHYEILPIMEFGGFYTKYGETEFKALFRWNDIEFIQYDELMKNIKSNIFPKEDFSKKTNSQISLLLFERHKNITPKNFQSKWEEMKK